MCKNLILSFGIVLLLPGVFFSQNPLWQWANEVSSPGNELAWDVCSDPSTGHVYIAGSYDANLGFIFGLPFITPGQTDGFVAKYTAAGNFALAFRIGGNDDDEIKSVAVDPGGNVYITGYFKGTADFDPSLFGTYNLTATGTSKDGFLAKYSSSGALAWAVKFGSAQNDEGLKVVADSNAVYLTGYYESFSTFYSTNTVTAITTTAQALSNFFGARYSHAGIIQWAVSGGSINGDAGHNVIADGSHVYFIGNYSDNFSFYNSSAALSSTLAAQTSNKTDVFICAYSLSGSFLWATNASSADDDNGFGLSQDSANIYVAGSFKNNTMSFPYPAPAYSQSCQGATDIFVASLAKISGNYLWVSQQSGSGANEETAYALKKDNYGGLVIAGTFKGSLNYTAFGGSTLSSSGNDDIFIATYDKYGNFLWSTKAGGTNKDVPYGLATGTTGAIYIAGEYANSLIFGTLLPLLNGAGKNVFVAKTGCEAVSNNTISSTQTICAGSAPLQLTGSLPLGGTGTYSYTWHESTNGFTWTPASGTNSVQSYTPPVLVSTKYYRRQVGSGGCLFPGNTVTVSVNSHPTSAVGGSSQTLCSSAATLSANPAVIGTGSWSVISGTASIASFTNPTTAVTGLSPGQNIFAWTISNGVCPPSTSSVTVFRDVIPSIANAGPSQTVCSVTATLTANTPAIGTGSWTVITGTAGLSSTTSASVSVSGLNVGPNSFAWIISNGVCPPSSSSVTIVRDALPSVANAGVNQTVCSASATVLANTPSVGSGVWSVINGTANITAVNNVSTSVSGLSLGANSFVWSVSNGVCPASSSTVSIFRDAPPTISNAGNNQTVCATSYSLNANTPVVGTGVWSLITGTGNVSMPNNPGAIVSGLSPGPNSFAWTISNGVCPPSSSTINIQSDTPPTNSNAGSNQTVCASTATLNANAPLVGTGNWTLTSGTGSIISVNNPTTVVSGLSAGQNTFVWVISNGICPSSSSTLSIQRDAPPDISNAGNNQTVCAATATLSANAPQTGTGTWAIVTGAGTLNAANSPTAIVSSLSTGTNVIVWIISNGVCPPSSSSVTVQSDAFPTASNAGNDQVICSDSTLLSGNIPLVGTGTWSVLSGAGNINPINNPSATISSLSAGTNAIAWIISNGTCPSSASTLSIVRDALPSVASAGVDQTLCAVSYTLSGNTPTVGAGSWSVSAGGAVLLSSSNPASPVSGLSQGINKFVWTISNGVCLSSSDTFLIYADTPPDQAEAPGNQTICKPNVLLAANSPSTGVGTWSLVSGNGNILQPFSETTEVSELGTGKNGFIWVISNGICPESRDSVFITRDMPPSPAHAGDNLIICGDSTRLNASGITTGLGAWRLLTGSGDFGDTTLSNTSITDLQQGMTVLSWNVRNGICPVSIDTLFIRADYPPTEADAGEDKITCSTSLRLQGNTPFVGKGSWQLVSGSVVISDTSLSTSEVRFLETGDHVLRWSIRNGSCPLSSKDILLTKVPAPPVAAAGPDQKIERSASSLSASGGSGTWSVLEGSANISDIHDPLSSVEGLSAGQTILRWTVVLGDCPESYDDVVIYVKPLSIPNAFSPNGDGFNDRFVITSLELYSNVRFSVFNRWGALVYENADYKNDWDGVNLLGQKLADDTYYYILEIPGLERMAGFIVSKQNK